MNASQLDLNALSQALDDHDPDREHFLDLEAGSLWTFVFSEATDEARTRYAEVAGAPGGSWVRIPSMTLQEAYEEIEDFVDSLPEGEVQDGLYRALERKGALRNFREAIMRLSEERQGWSAHRRQGSRRRLEAFLETNGIVVPEAAS
jgi:hypothetical protein